METRKKLRSVAVRTHRTRAGSPRAPSPGTARAQLARKLAVPALVLASLGSTAAASPGNGAHHMSPARAVLAREAAARICQANRMPWMYTVPNHMPWMYAVPNRMPWMYAVPNHMPWMNAVLAGTSPRFCPARTPASA